MTATQEWQDLNAAIINCRKCPRLVAYREEIARIRRRAYRDQEYWGRPAPGFGDPQARVLVVGLAPGAHGANRTGRMFTGDGSGDFLYGSLYRTGFANQPTSSSRDDGLQLSDLFISAVCRCAPPDNKPAPEEQRNCQPYLGREIALLEGLRVIVALGRIGFEGVLRTWPTPKVRSVPPFAHGAVSHLGNDGPWLVASYHPSRQNTQTGRLTVAMLDSIWEKVKVLLRAD